MKELGQKIKKYRNNLDLSQEEVAARVGIDRSYLSEIETGKRPGVSLTVIEKIASVIDCPPSVLIGALTEEEWKALVNLRQLSKTLTKKGEM